MTVFGFDLDNPLLAAVAWCQLTEPSDAVAGTLIAHLGPSEALHWLDDTIGGTLITNPPIETSAPRWGQALAGGIARWSTRLAVCDPSRDLEILRRLGGTLLTPTDPRWPRGLSDLEVCAPHVLWVLGNPDLSARLARSVSLVGARAATAYGEHVATNLAGSLRDRGFAIVSGGAYGIDAAAHRGALAAGGDTLAVMAGGVDRLYPAGNLSLIERIAEVGTVICESPPGASPMKQRFLSRNRLIAALTPATVVVEAAWRSGALSTARHAANLMRAVGAVPGPVTSMASGGCHQLLRDQVAVCVTDAAEIAELAGSSGADAAPDRSTSATDTRATDGLDPATLAVLEAFPARSAIDVDTLMREAGRPLGEVLSALGLLELRGLIRPDGASWRRASTVQKQ